MTFPRLDLALSHDPLEARAVTLIAVGRGLAERLAAGQRISRQTLKTFMKRHFGGSDASGAWSMRDGYDALEIAQVLLAEQEGSGLIDWTDRAGAYHRRADLLQGLPTQTYRSERQLDMQQFSTPLTLAWLGACAARMTADDVVLEPSAGTGMLAVHARKLGARLVLNERDPLRALILSGLFGEAVKSHDAEFIGDLIDADDYPNVILVNPPFGRSETRGRDRHAGARHLRSALACLAPGGRCVAIMPPGFSRDGSGARGYEVVGEIAKPRFEITIEGTPYAKHGTSVSVRILIYDKGWSGDPVRHFAADPAAALPLILACPERLGDMPPPALDLVMARLPARPTKLPGKAGLLRSSLARAPLAPPPPPAVESDPVAVAYDLLDVPPPPDEQIGIYVPWRLTRMAFSDPRPHPEQLVESVAMSSILPPVPHYVPLLPPRARATLSDAQLETVIYAGQAFDRDIPGRYKPNEAGTLLAAHADGAVYRMGFMVGDGTGVGKGRQIAAIILDRWCRGQRRAVWISKSAALLEDARRDWSALGGLAIDIQPLDSFPLGGAITMESGILFLTFATLRSARDDSQSRLGQILAWLGPDFEGVIALDEAHELANAAGTETSYGMQKGSEQGLAGVRLQNLRPRACILYNSATGATDPANLCYASRLGLWGHGAFETREAFMTAIGDGGIAAMEIVASDLKAMGLYTARALTFTGVEYDPLEHVLTVDQIAIYDAYADAWALIHHHLDAVLEATAIIDKITGKTLNAQAKGAALSRFESAKQRFFGQLLIGLKLPTLIKAIEGDVAAGRHAVVQLVTTSEAMLERQIGNLAADERASLEIEISPREYLVQYLEHAFPTRQMRTYKGEDGEIRSEPMIDMDGNPVHSKEALAARAELLERLCAMPAIPGALDDLLRHFGSDAIAEVTGRSRRIVLDAGGRQGIERRTARSNIAEAEAFMSGAKAILVFSDAGGTGRSYHADRLCPTAGRRRVHYLLEPGWRASSAIQGLGRTNRTNQASAPIFRPVTTDCRGERRFISTIARRLDSLGALTRGQRQTGGQNLFDPADNLESDYAREALGQWYRLLYRGKLESVSLADFIAMTGLKLVSDEDGSLLDNLPPIQRWLNRLLALRIATQNAIFGEYMSLIQARIDAAREKGTLDIGVETIAVEKIVTIEEQVLRRDPEIGAVTLLSRLELHRKRRARSLDDLMARWSETEGIALLRNERSGKVALKVPSWSILDNEGETIEVWEIVRPAGSERMRARRLAETAWVETDEAHFRAAWVAECAKIEATLAIDTINIATGLLLPVWHRLPEDDVRVWRICDKDGRSLLGRIISAHGFEKLASTFGVAMSLALSPAELVAASRSRDGVAFGCMPGARLVRVRVNDEARLEIRGFPPARLASLKALGCFTEIIAFKTRLFVPANGAEAIIEAIEQAFAMQGGRGT